MHAAIECDSAALQIRLLSCGMGVALVASGSGGRSAEGRWACACCIRTHSAAGLIYVRTLGRFLRRAFARLLRIWSGIFAQMA